MKNKVFSIGIALLSCLVISFAARSQKADEGLRVVFIRHGEKPKIGDNLTCQGLNRSLLLPAVLYSRFGIPVATYIPAIGMGDSTKHSRMFQTIIPFAVKYNLALNSKFGEKDSAEIGTELLGKKGTVLVVWEHKAIAPIVRALGIKNDSLKWSDEDYDSIWIVSLQEGVARLEKATEGLKPEEGCKF